MKELQNPSAFDAYQRFDTKVKCPTGHNFGSNSPLHGDASQMPGLCPMGGGGGGGGFGIGCYNLHEQNLKETTEVHKEFAA